MVLYTQTASVSIILRIIARIAKLAVILMLSACTVGPDFKRPTAPDVKSYTDNDQLKQTPQTLVSGRDIPAQWWTVFHSKPLTALIEKAIKHNPDLASAQATLIQAQEMATAKQGSLFPAIDASVYGVRQKVAGAQFGNPAFRGSVFELYNTSVNVSYTLDVFGGVRRQIEDLSAQSEYQHFQLEGAFLTLANNIVTTAIQAASLKAQIVATEEIIDAQSQQLNVIKQQFELGGVAKAAVLAQQSTFEQTKTTLPPLQQQLAQVRHRLSVLVGDYPNNDLTKDFNLSELTLPDKLPLTIPSKLVVQRPDVRAQEAVLHSTSAQIGVVTASIFPDFTISADIGSIATQVGNLFMPGSLIWNFGGKLVQPVFHGGDFTHKKKAAVAAYQEAAGQYRSTVLQAFQNVADVLSALDYDAAELKAQEAAEGTAHESLELTRSQFQIGAVSYLALLTAERDYQQARIGQIKAKATRLADTAALFQALGGGWWNRVDLAKQIMAEQKKHEKPCGLIECLLNPLANQVP